MRALSLALATALALSGTAAPLTAGTAQAAARHHRAPGPAATVIRDPRAFVAEVYRRLEKGGPYQPPEDIYTPRLAALWAGAVHDARGEVPRVDFMFWINGQDGDISDVQISTQKVDQRPQNDRAVVIASFKNSGRPEELHLYFVRTKVGWKLDDVESFKGEVWTLSLLLQFA